MAKREGILSRLFRGRAEAKKEAEAKLKEEAAASAKAAREAYGKVEAEEAAAGAAIGGAAKKVTGKAKAAQVAAAKATYVVQPGDSLSAIAKKLMGDANLWPKLYEANKDIIGDNPDLIHPGQEFTIPDVD